MRGLNILEKEEYKGFEIKLEEGVLEHIAASAGGDVRKALNSLEISLLTTSADGNGIINVTLDTAEQAVQKKVIRYDKDGDSHYDVLSAFQKSIRGSDPDGAVHYLARLLSAGDMQSVCRRLLVIAAEDIGLAYPTAITIVKSCVDSALQIGMPEAQLPLAEATILLATSPKSNSVTQAISMAMSDIERRDTGDVPMHIKDAHYSGAKNLGHGTEYKFPHDYENHYISQQYLPDNIKDVKYYTYGDNKNEQAAKNYWERIKKGK